MEDNSYGFRVGKMLIKHMDGFLRFSFSLPSQQYDSILFFENPSNHSELRAISDKCIFV